MVPPQTTVGDDDDSGGGHSGISTITADSTVTMLIASEVDVDSACRLIEWMSHQEVGVDVCLVGGPLAPAAALEPNCLNPTKEQSLAAEGDATSVVALFETIVCRVCYVPGHLDPPSLRGEGDKATQHPRLTPNSINIHERLLQLLPGLYLTGFTEPADFVSVAESRGGNDVRPDSDDEDTTLPGGSKLPEQSTVDAIARSLNGRDLCPDCSVIMLNYRATLPPPPPPTNTDNQDLPPPPSPCRPLPSYLQAYLGSRQCQRNLLLHICVFNESLPHEAVGCSYRVGQVTVVRPGSLKYGNYCLVKLGRKGEGCGWEVADIDFRKYPAPLQQPS